MIIAFANQKGGVGKTTSAINIAASLGIIGKKVLLCDVDPQSNATSGVGFKKREISQSVYDVISGNADILDAVKKTAFENLSLLPADIDLAGAEIELADEPASKRFSRLKNALETVEDDYDCIVVDCPPALGILTVNALCAADYVVVPMQCEYFALEGLSQLVKTINQIKSAYNPALSLGGIIVTMYDGRLNLSVQVLDELKKFFPDKVMKSYVPRTVRISESPSYGMPIYYYDRLSRASDAYLALARELCAVLG